MIIVEVLFGVGCDIVGEGMFEGDELSSDGFIDHILSTISDDILDEEEIFAEVPISEEDGVIIGDGFFGA